MLKFIVSQKVLRNNCNIVAIKMIKNSLHSKIMIHNLMMMCCIAMGRGI